MSIYFNKDIINIIFQFDPTYHIIFKKNILPYLQKKWFVKWICKSTKTSGLDFSGFNGLTTNKYNINMDNYSYNYFYCLQNVEKKMKFIKGLSIYQY
jgi:hypothetical protein